jgi:hypothetical protein
MKIRTKAPNVALTKELNENTNKSAKFWFIVWQDWRENMMLTLRSIPAARPILAKFPNITRTINP